MNTLSSDSLFYRGLVGLIIFPFVIFFFTKMCFIDAFTATGAFIIDCLIGVFLVIQWYKAFKTQKVVLTGKGLATTNYLTGNTMNVSVEDIVSIRKVFSVGMSPSNFYKIIVNDDGKRRRFYFFKDPSLPASVDLLDFVKHRQRLYFGGRSND